MLLRAFEVDRLNEEVHRELVITYWAMGRRDEAMRQYVRCGRVLADELGISPSRRDRKTGTSDSSPNRFTAKVSFSGVPHPRNKETRGIKRPGKTAHQILATFPNWPLPASSLLQELSSSLPIATGHFSSCPDRGARPGGVELAHWKWFGSEISYVAGGNAVLSKQRGW